ncbi:ASCH domain-containing protein [Hyphobacterium marinum]|uniref:ASCH domain-containing protein n=1 Tax=Hyphobacterium marinum TaxID=3116574 RepID=A0ABU7LYA4_9PROT|nr:ASCH domain-containing protein [Hyphobacterium sp. Y6023]MEE2566523.1 ASCH domain-containing protein [Hyphobacterium sp. Y6023]
MTPQQAEYWSRFQAETGIGAAPRGAEAFGDDPVMQDELCALVLAGTKRATCSLARWFENDPDGFPKPGDYWIFLDGKSEPRGIIRTTEVEVKPIREADAQFAWDEGEGDRSFDYWITEHRKFWQREAARNGFDYSDDLHAVFERFELVWPKEKPAPA